MPPPLPVPPAVLSINVFLTQTLIIITVLKSEENYTERNAFSLAIAVPFFFFFFSDYSPFSFVDPDSGNRYEPAEREGEEGSRTLRATTGGKTTSAAFFLFFFLRASVARPAACE